MTTVVWFRFILLELKFWAQGAAACRAQPAGEAEAQQHGVLLSPERGRTTLVEQHKRAPLPVGRRRPVV